MFFVISEFGSQWNIALVIHGFFAKIETNYGYLGLLVALDSTLYIRANRHGPEKKSA